MIQSIIKRDGRAVLYKQKKIAAAILKAMEAAQIVKKAALLRPSFCNSKIILF